MPKVKKRKNTRNKKPRNQKKTKNHKRKNGENAKKRKFPNEPCKPLIWKKQKKM